MGVYLSPVRSLSYLSSMKRLKASLIPSYSLLLTIRCRLFTAKAY